MSMNVAIVFQIVFSVLLGASLGSFLNVVAHRSVEGRSWWGKERSVCESCRKVLTTLELIPLVSWLVQRGRCRGCGARISSRYFIVELIGATAAGLVAWRWGFSWAYIFSMVGIVGLLLNALTDYESGYVFDGFALFIGICGFLLRIAGGRDALIDGLIGAAMGWSLFAVIIAASRIVMGSEGMGWGDACFMGGIGVVFGWKMTLLAFYMGVMAGGVTCIALLLRGKVKRGRGDSLPLVPYLALGCFLTFLCGPEVLYAIGLRFQHFLQAGWPW
jgi:leader peptidase (prepilin peptidase)/N-methyltransferase